MLSLLLLTPIALAGDHPASILPVVKTGGDGLLLVVGGELTGPPSALVNGENFGLLDDGAEPDALSGDGVFTVRVPLASIESQDETTVAILESDATVLWEDTIPEGSAQVRPLVKVLADDLGTATVQVTFLGKSDQAGAPPPPSGESKAPPDPPVPPSPLLTTVLPVAVALGVGGLLGALFQRRRKRGPSLAPVGASTRHSTTLEIWSIPRDVELGAVVAGLAVQQLCQGPVLLVPRSGSRPALSLRGRTGLVWMDADRPLTRQIAESVAALSIVGTPAVVIEGLEALEEPVEDEAPDALLDELRQFLACPVIVLVPSGTPLRAPPTCVFSMNEGHLLGTAGRFERSGAGWQWQPGTGP